MCMRCITHEMSMSPLVWTFLVLEVIRNMSQRLSDEVCYFETGFTVCSARGGSCPSAFACSRTWVINMDSTLRNREAHLWTATQGLCYTVS